MSSDLFVFENTFFSDLFSPFADSTINDSLPDLHLDQNGAGLIIRPDETTPFDQISAALLSSSPPSFQLENLSLISSQLGNAAEYLVKTEECRLNLDASFSGFGNSFPPHSFDETAAKFMQRSFSSNSFDNRHQNFCFRPRFDGVLEPQHSPKRQILSSPADGSSSSSGQMRRVCSAGDLQKVQTRNAVVSASPLSAEKSLMEEAYFKVGRYSAEERKEKIDRYRAKRTQRNFHKTIKYACRKTLADNRPRIRGRFARNDEAAGEIPKASMFHRYEDDDDLWIDGFNEDEEEGIGRRGVLFNNNYNTTASADQYQNYSY